MSSEAPAPAIAAPVAAPIAADTTAPPTDTTPASFGASVLGKEDDVSKAVAEQDAAAEPEAAAGAAPAPETSEQDAAAVAAAAAAAAAADASSAAQTITELATAATNAANNASIDAEAAAALEQPAAAEGAPAEPSAVDASDATAQPSQADAPAAPTDGATDEAAAAAAEEESTSGLPRSIESELRDIYTVSSAIANFCVAHVNQVNVPTPQKVRTIIQKALKLTSSLSMLLAQPEVALRQLDADEHGKRPAESKLDSARKRQRSSDWDGTKGAGSMPGLPMAPFTPTSGLRVFPDGSLPTSFPSPGFDGEGKGPQYKKRSRAPAPGSCQACGTSETPEWRRGPDGARTLCNACGLHYAKLVRKRMQQEGGEEMPSPSQPQQVSLVSLEELRASTKSAEAAAAAGSMTPSGSSTSLNGTPMKGERGGTGAWNTPSKPPRVPSGLSASVVAGELGEKVGESAPVPATEGIVEPAPTPVVQEQQQQVEPVIAPELENEGVPAQQVVGEERPMETDQ